MRCRQCGAVISLLWLKASGEGGPEARLGPSVSEGSPVRTQRPPAAGDGRCPACRQGVRREDPAEALEQAEALLRRIQAEGHPELGRLAASTRGRVEILRRRAAGRG